MIFVSVGSQLPFDRLIRNVDQWAGNNKQQFVFAQIGNSEFKPVNIEFCQSLTPDEYSSYFSRAEIIIAHAGMGTIISALEYQKPLILLPRLACYGEHRNDHQLATAKYFSSYNNIFVADNEDQISGLIELIIKNKSKFDFIVNNERSDNLISTIRKFVLDAF